MLEYSYFHNDVVSINAVGIPALCCKHATVRCYFFGIVTKLQDVKLKKQFAVFILEIYICSILI